MRRRTFARIALVALVLVLVGVLAYISPLGVLAALLSVAGCIVLGVLIGWAVEQ